MEIYIYKIEAPNGKVYIGQTNQYPLWKRARSGWGYQSNKELFADIMEYGWNNFTDEVIDTAETIKDAYIKEGYWIAFYNSADPEYGYNKMSNHSTLKRAGLVEDKKIPKYSNVETGEVFYTLEEAGASVDRTRQAISQAIIHHRPCAGYHWVRLD